MLVPCLGNKQSEDQDENTTQKKSIKNNANNQRNSQRPYIVVPYYQGLSESIKRTCNKYGVQVHLKGGVTIKKLLVAPKDQDPMLKKSGSSKDINVAGSTVMENIYESLPEHLGKGSRNTKRPYAPYMTTIALLVTRLA